MALPYMNVDPNTTDPLARDSLERRRALRGLLRLRNGIAIWAAERRAHELEGLSRGRAVQTLYDIDALIFDLYPEVWGERLAEWRAMEAALEHGPRERHPDCGICLGIAALAQSDVETDGSAK